MKGRCRIIALMTISLAALGGSVFPQEEIKFGIINSQEVLERSAEGKKAFAQLQEADKKYHGEILQLDDQIKQIENRLTTQRLTLSPEAAMALQADLDKRRTERQRRAEDALKAMQQLQFRLFDKIEDELMPLIEQLRRDRGLDIIFDLAKGGAVAIDPGIDLTEELIRRYDASKAAPPIK